MTRTRPSLGFRFAVLPLALVLSAGCQRKTEPPAPESAAPTRPAGAVAQAPTAATATIQLTSAAFAEGQPVPKKHTADGADVSPPLAWSGIPPGTKELALVCDDPDAPTPEPWVHWVIYKIPADAKGLSEGVPGEETLREPPGALQGKNSWDDARAIGYRGPDPPPGKMHRYVFRLYALDAPLALKPAATKAQLKEAVSGHVVGEGTLTGTYRR